MQTRQNRVPSVDDSVVPSRRSSETRIRVRRSSSFTELVELPETAPVRVRSNAVDTVLPIMN